jgi:DNA-binding Lrp family transcriptional regulator
MPISASDAALIALLRENGRASVADLARRLGVSRTTAQSRIAKLEKTGIAWGPDRKIAGCLLPRGCDTLHRRR